jgi:putative membrane-bound dehydrogenase-like protein
MRFATLLTLLLASSGTLLAQKEFGFDNRKSSGQPYLSPEETVKRMQMAPGFECKLYAGEPSLVNPIAMTVDERGRVWVVECFEYPKRTPKGQMPRDRIRILEDTDGDGVCDKSTIFAEGKDFPKSFDLASGIEVGNGGVYLGAPPYLWFLKDENGDDKADKFEILLSGFGSQDTHETLNTFNWGPDGALYGLHGVFTYSDVKPEQADGPVTRMNAAIWRYEPKTKKFEIFAEGTSNPWGIDWRNTDGQYILACCVIPHLFHISEGGIYKRQAGQSYNPYTYGYINEICDHQFHKESGWAHAGLISLDTPLMPEEYRDRVIFGSIHGCAIKQNQLHPRGSSFLATRVDNFLTSGDKNYRPINLRWGPNGEIFSIDWHDQNPCHQALPDAWDYERGRVYRLQTVGLKTKKPEDLGKWTNTQLIEGTRSPNPYIVRTSLRLLHERKGGTSHNDRISLLKRVETSKSLADFQALYAIDSLDRAAEKILNGGSIDKAQQPMFLRLLERTDYPKEKWLKVAMKLLEQSSPQLRLQVAGSLQRLQGKADLRPITRILLSHGEDAKDHALPQMYWLAYQQVQLSQNDQAEIEWITSEAKANPVIREVILPRLVRKFASTGKPEAFAAVMKLLEQLPDETTKKLALDGLIESTQGRQFDEPDGWSSVRNSLAQSKNAEIRSRIERLSVTFRDQVAIQKAIDRLKDSKLSVSDRIQAVRSTAVAKSKAAVSPVLNLATDENSPLELRIEATRALSSFDDAKIPAVLLVNWAKFPNQIRVEAVEVLTSRKPWGEKVLLALQQKSIDRSQLSSNAISRLQSFNDPKLNDSIEKYWGKVRATPDELNKTIDKMRGELFAGSGSFLRGKKVFEAQCAKCHKFDGAGNEVGPNLDGAGRDVEYLLANILDPNRVIGAPYFMRTINLLNGKVETGVLHAEDDQTISLKGENAILKVIAKKEIEESKIQEKSLMPEGLAYNMTVQDFRDLVRYLQANAYVNEVQLTQDGRTTKPVVNPSGQINVDGKKARIESRMNVAAPVKTRLVLSGGVQYQITVNRTKMAPVDLKGKPVAAEQGEIEIQLERGENLIVIETDGPAKSIAFRFVDPDRKISYEGVK